MSDTPICSMLRSCMTTLYENTCRHATHIFLGQRLHEMLAKELFHPAFQPSYLQGYSLDGVPVLVSYKLPEIGMSLVVDDSDEY